LGAGLDDYWNLMRSNPLSAGGFLWVFADEGVVRRDKNDSIDCRGNLAPDGILGPYREKEGSFYAIKDIWSPVQFEKKNITRDFDGILKIENRFFYTDFKDCKFTAGLETYPSFPGSGTKTLPLDMGVDNLEPGQKGICRIQLPDGWNGYDVLRITAVDPHGRHIQSWSWNISHPAQMAGRIVSASGSKASVTENDKYITVSSGNSVVRFDKSTGLLAEVSNAGKTSSFRNGPSFEGINAKFKTLKYHPEGDNIVVEAEYESKPHCEARWTVLPGGWLQLEYNYRPSGSSDFWGISFNYPDSLVTGAALLGNGPYHVWKNRMRGPSFGLFEKKYNNTVTGESWDYPEFKGYYSNFYAVEIRTREMPIRIVSATDNLFLHLFTPQAPKHAAGGVTPPFPKGDISVLHAISAIGTKFSKAESSGPQGAKNEYSPNSNSPGLSGKLYFKFGE
jgi:hypothetical protein